MKSVLSIIAACFLFASGSSGEREDLQSAFDRENREADAELEKASSTSELVGAAGHCHSVAAKHLRRALDCKLRHTSDPAERRAVLERFHEFGREIENVLNTPREGRGREFGIHVYCRAAFLTRRQTEIFLLDENAEKRWKRFADAVLVMPGRHIRLQQGAARFSSALPEPEELEVRLFPRDTFSRNGRHWAVVRVAAPWGGKADDSAAYLCELVNGELIIRARCDLPITGR